MNKICTVLNCAIILAMCACCDSSYMFEDEKHSYYEMAKSEEYMCYKLSDYYFKNAGKEYDKGESIDVTDEYNNLAINYNRFITQYPEYLSLSSEEKDEVLRIAAHHNDLLYSYAKDEIEGRKLTRSSNSNSEQSSIAYMHITANWNDYTSYYVDKVPFYHYQDALSYCTNIDDEETGGIIFSDNSALWLRTVGSNRMQYRLNHIPKITGTTVEGIFHYHPDGSKPSPEDYTSGLTWSQKQGISYSIVYSNNRIYKCWF